MTTPQQLLERDPDAWRSWADSQLRPMDLDVALLHSVLETGQRAHADASPLAPPAGPGTDRWQESVIAFRELTTWSPDEGDGLARTVHPSGDFCVIVRGGINGVGEFSSHTPTPRNGLGSILQDVIDEKPEQSSMFYPDLKPRSAPRESALEYWLFLALYFRGVIYSELSRPSRRIGNRVTKYAQRIQLPPLHFDDGHDADVDTRPSDDDDSSTPPSAVVDVEPL